MTSKGARAKSAVASLWRQVSARARTRWAKAVAALAAAVVLVGLIAPYFLDADRYRGAIAQLISQQSGRQVTLGKIRAQFLPRVGFSVEDAHLANPPGFVAGELVAAQQVRGALAFWPLVLHHEFLLTSLELDRPRLTLVEDGRGRNNYTFAPAGPLATAGLAQALPVAPLSGSSPALQVAQLTLRDAEVIFGNVDAAGRVTPVVDAAGLNADLRQLQLDPLDVRVWQADAKLAATRLALANWSGPIVITSGSVKLRGGALEASLAADLGKAAHVDATVSVADVERAVVQFDLRSPDVDVNALLAGYRPPAAAAPKRAEASAAKVVFAATDHQTAPTPPYVGVPIAVGHLTAQKIRVKPYAAGPLTVDVRLYAERAEIWPFTLRLEGGSIQATARTDQQQRPRRFSANLEARNIDIGRLLNPYPAVRGKFAGTGEFDVQMFGSLDAAWRASLEGHGQFAVRNGRIAGFNLAGVAQSLASAAGLSGDTPFTAITGDLALQREQVSSRDIHLASPRGTVDLRGWCRFDSVLSYDGQASVDLSAGNGGATQPGTNADPTAAAISKLAKQIGRVTVPISVRGTLEHPELAPAHGVPNFPIPDDPKQPGAFPNLFGK